jgi:hypothetical protein
VILVNDLLIVVDLSCFLPHQLSFFFYCLTAVINVNIDCPEANHEAFVFPLKEIQGVKKGTSYYGYYIMIPMDVRFILDDQTIEHYKAQLFANHQVLLMMPSWDYSPLYNHDEIIEKVASNVTDVMDNACHAFEDNKASHRWNHLSLKFRSVPA